MNSLTENDNELFRNSISYLHKISGLDISPPTLKCIYLTKARLMELRRNIQLPFSVTSNTVRCQRCFLPLKDGPASYRIKPEKKKSKFARRLLAKCNKDKPMTKYQRKYFKRLDRFDGNQLSITCKFCEKETLVKLGKPKQPVHSKVTKTKRSKRKMKKKDKFCGLNEEAVLSLTPKTKNTAKKSEVCQKLNKKLPRFKLKRKENLVKTVEVKTTENARETQKKQKRKDKLREFLNTSPNKSSPSENLKNFLQSL